MDVRFGPQVGQIGTKWDKYGIFFRSSSQKALKSDMKEILDIVHLEPIWAQIGLFQGNTLIPWFIQ